MKKKVTIPKLVDRLDKIFSKYIRLRDALATTGTTEYAVCVTCGRTKDQKYNMDAGHFVGRGAGAVRFDERNVHAQCKRCNMGGNPTAHLDYDAWIIERYGKRVRNELIKKGKQTHRWDRAWLEDKIVEYREKVKELK